jgi:hypothetical protein
MERERKIIRQWLLFFMIALSVSGITAMPVQSEINFLYKWTENIAFIQPWMEKLHTAINETAEKHPFLFYGYDWLAFAHLLLALLFIGPLRDPVKNKWVIEFAIYACLLVLPFALIAGHFRDIPFWWRLVDCSFGIAGLIPLSICLRKIKKLEEKELAEKKKYQFDLLIT